ncbi:hypothetical protein B296_00022498 [Ensete ventricosum]|uniref:Uncharacterized protein n=1 Tax=Ensete ventricosum TaxID=4639 RepID=A0A426ZYJ4_ENSVE|nr:hypothetical protein B296_00022498 [Ensete ventricosum]
MIYAFNIQSKDGAASNKESSIQKAENVISTMLAKGLILGKGALESAKSFDEKHQLSSTAMAKVSNLDHKIGLTEKISIGTSAVNEKVLEMDHRYQVSEKARSAITVAEQKISNVGSAAMENKYVFAGVSWMIGAINKVAKTASEVGTKAVEKATAERQQNRSPPEDAQDQLLYERVASIRVFGFPSFSIRSLPSRPRDRSPSMASPPPNSSVSVGGKGSSLSPAAVYAVSQGLASVTIDPAALEKLSLTKRTSPLNPKRDGPSNSRLLTLEESRAALAVLLNKFVLSDAAVRPSIPSLIADTLALPSGHESVDFGSVLGFLNSIFQLNSRNVGEIELGREEAGVFETSCAASVGVCAMLDCCSSALAKVADAVAALSCEAARVDVSAFDLFGSGDGFSIKDETDVASDMKVLLFGSKLVGQNESGSFNEIPTVNASFREAVRTLHGRTRVELNSTVKFKKSMVFGNHGKEKVFAGSVLPLAMSMQSMIESSLGRLKSTINMISDNSLRSRVAEAFEKACPSLDGMRDQFQSITEKAASKIDYFLTLHYVYEYLVKFREVLAWEAAVALFALEIDDSIEKPQVDQASKVNGDVAKGEKKTDKKKKKTLGKGTSSIRQLLRDSILCKSEPSSENVAVLVEWACDLAKYFDPKDTRIDYLLTKVKEIVESNEVRRLPKIPKVRNTK